MSNTEASHEAPEGSTPTPPPAAVEKSPWGRALTVALVLACGGVALYAAYGSPTPTATIAEVDSTVQADDSKGSHPSAPAQLAGTVKEIIQVSSYTYLRVGPKSGKDFWAAVTKTNVPEGSDVSFDGAELMRNFSSKELDRTFDSIYFARLAGGAGLDPNHGGNFPPPSKEEGAAAKKAAALMAEEIEVKNSAKAEGPLGHTVGELYAQGKAIAGKKVRVRGTVVKLTKKVMGTNFLHVRDGSGNPAKGSHDIVLKVAEAPPSLGEEAEFEGVATVDVDLGAGYSYPFLLEEARVISK